MAKDNMIDDGIVEDIKDEVADEVIDNEDVDAVDTVDINETTDATTDEIEDAQIEDSVDTDADTEAERLSDDSEDATEDSQDVDTIDDADALEDKDEDASEEIIETSAETENIVPIDGAIELVERIPVYANATAIKPIGYVKGTLFIVDGVVSMGRVRIANNKELTDIIGWCDKEQI